MCDPFPLPGEKERAEQALNELPSRVRRFYVAHYQVVGSKPVGEFVGLACRCCNKWREYGHSPDCPVRDLEEPDEDVTGKH